MKSFWINHLYVDEDLKLTHNQNTSYFKLNHIKYSNIMKISSTMHKKMHQV